MSGRRVPRPEIDYGRPSPGTGSQTLADLVKEFLLDFGCGPDEDRKFYAGQKSLKSAIRAAGMARTMRKDREIRHPHQWRLSDDTLSRARKALEKAIGDIGQCESFEELWSLVKGTIGAIHGIGDLTVYDTAVRIGFFLGLEPEVIYLHAGTRKGAAALGLGRGKQSIAVSELPQELRKLTPSQIEDFLCIFKDQLKALYRRTGRLGR